MNYIFQTSVLLISDNGMYIEAGSHSCTELNKTVFPCEYH